jgi:hypothetical protein
MSRNSLFNICLALLITKAQFVDSRWHSLSVPGGLPQAPTYSWQEGTNAGATKGWQSSPPSGGNSGGGSVGGGSSLSKDFDAMGN